MKPAEKKYKVNSFTNILKILKIKGAKKEKEITSTHYYGQHNGNDVIKFVEYCDRFEIHKLKNVDGKMLMTDHKVIPDKKTGFLWLKKQGFSQAGIVKMDYTEYSYKNGIIGLYIINDFLKSVILYYSQDIIPSVEKVFNLNNNEVITIPYNKYLESIKRLRMLKL